MKSEINLIESFGRYKKYVWVFILVFIVVFIAGAIFIKLHPEETKYISRSKFEIINGENILYLYQGVYRRITTFDDMASVLRSNEVLNEVVTANDIDTSLNEFRQNIDLYENSSNIYTLEFLYPDKSKGEEINLSLIDSYFNSIYTRLHPEHVDLFDVEVLQQPESRVISSRVVNKIVSVLLFSIFCGIMGIIIIEVIKRVTKRFKNKYK